MKNHTVFSHQYLRFQAKTQQMNHPMNKTNFWKSNKTPITAIKNAEKFTKSTKTTERKKERNTNVCHHQGPCEQVSGGQKGEKS